VRTTPLTGLLVALLLLTACGPQAPEGPPQDTAQDPARDPARAGAPPTDAWRTEVWRGVAVDVPADWSWGQGPVAGMGGGRLRCTDEPQGEAAYVGRPVMGSDVCGLPQGVPAAEHLWFDAGLEVGEEDLGDGWTRLTREVAGVSVTVTTQDPALRDAVLASARSQDLCPERPASPVFESTTEGPGVLIDAVVCFYREDRSGEQYLALAREVDDEETVRGLWRSVSFLDEPLCLETEGEVAVLRSSTRDTFGADDAAPLVQRVVVPLLCPGAVTALRAVTDPALRATSSTLIGPLG